MLGLVGVLVLLVQVLGLVLLAKVLGLAVALVLLVPLFALVLPAQLLWLAVVLGLLVQVVGLVLPAQLVVFAVPLVQQIIALAVSAVLVWLAPVAFASAAASDLPCQAIASHSQPGTLVLAQLLAPCHRAFGSLVLVVQLVWCFVLVATAAAPCQACMVQCFAGGVLVLAAAPCGPPSLASTLVLLVQVLGLAWALVLLVQVIGLPVAPVLLAKLIGLAVASVLLSQLVALVLPA